MLGLILVNVLLYNGGVVKEVHNVNDVVESRLVEYRKTEAGTIIPITRGTRGYRSFNVQVETTYVEIDSDPDAIAEYCAIAADGMYIFVNWRLNYERVSLYTATTYAGVEPLWEYDATDEFNGQVGISHNGDAIGASELYYGYQWCGLSGTPEHIYDIGVDARGTIVSRDGSKIIFLGYDYDADKGKVYVYDAETHALLYEYEVNLPPQGVDCTPSGDTIAVSTYDSVYVFAAGEQLASLHVDGCQFAPAISADGRRLVTGDYDGYMRVYEWDGTAYQQIYSHHVPASGGYVSWVFCIDISDDGNTIIMGTNCYVPTDNYVACFKDTGDGFQLMWKSYRIWTSILSCRLTSDGTLGIAGGAGNGSTDPQGDVLCVYNMVDSTPILNIPNYVEPGSITWVDISTDGEWACGSGKAVSVYEWGRGGQVYCIHVGEVITHDVAVIDIVEPEVELTFETYTPMARFINLGMAAIDTFVTYFDILDTLGTILYQDSVVEYDLQPGSLREVEFNPWTCTEYGIYTLRAYVAADEDVRHENDTMMVTSYCKHDATVTDIVNPFDEVSINYHTPVVVGVKNSGSFSDTITVVTKVSHGVDTLYSDTGRVYLEPGDATYVELDRFTPTDTGTYVVNTTVYVGDEFNPYDNVMTKPFTCTYELLYDDGERDVWYYVSSEYHDNKFAVRFVPTIDVPMVITHARVYVSAGAPFAISINVDSAGLPGDEIVGPDTFIAEESGWVTLYCYHEMDTLAPVWVVFHWIATSPAAPWVGTDLDYPIDSMSYWYYTGKGGYPHAVDYAMEPTLQLVSKDGGWNQFTGGDWMIRLMVTPPAVGVPDIEVMVDSLYSSMMVTDVGWDTLGYDDGTMESGVGLTAGVGFTPDEAETYGFATKFVTPQPTTLQEVWINFYEFNGSSFRLYIWRDNNGVPGSGQPPLFVDMAAAAPESTQVWNVYPIGIQLADTVVWIGLCYNYIGGTGNPDWRLGVDQNTQDDHTYGNLGGEPDDWTPMSSHGYGYAYGVRVVTGGTGLYSDTISFYVYNMGEANLMVSDIVWDATWISSITPSGFVVTPGDSTDVEVVVTNAGLLPGVYHDTITIVSNDPDTPELMIPITLTVELVGIGERVVEGFKFNGLYPNPANDKVLLEYGVGEPTDVIITVYDVMGRLIHRVVRSEQPGHHVVKLNTGSLPMGTYFVTVKLGDKLVRSKFIIVK